MVVLFCILNSNPAFSQSITVDLDHEGEFSPQKLLVPFAFYNELVDAGLGLAFSTKGYLQPQMGTILSGFISTNESWTIYLASRDFQFPVVRRLFFSPQLSLSRLEVIEGYRDGNPNFPNERAGSNDSSEDNFIEGDGDDEYYRFTLSYLLPMGHAKEEAINTYVLNRGILHSGATGGEYWNPLKTGRTFLEVTPFYRNQKLNSNVVAEDALRTNGMEFSLIHDNTDLEDNPSIGSYQRFTLSRDWGEIDSTAPWTVVEGEFSKYFSLGETETFRQRVLAFNFWTAKALTWDDSSTIDGKETFHRPPNFAGATLGGLDRLRGFPEGRFSDEAAIYYVAEYRVIPKWHPLGKISWLEFARIQWWQWVGFAEVGRVAEEWVLSDLHSDMKWDVGVAIRALVRHLLVRVDMAYSEDGGGVQMFVGHPF